MVFQRKDGTTPDIDTLFEILENFILGFELTKLFGFIEPKVPQVLGWQIGSDCIVIDLSFITIILWVDGFELWGY